MKPRVPRAFDEVVTEPKFVSGAEAALFFLGFIVAAMNLLGLFFVFLTVGPGFVSFQLPSGWGVMRLGLLVWLAAGLILAARLIFFQHSHVRYYNFVWAFTGIGVLAVRLILHFTEVVPTGFLIFGALVSSFIAWADQRLEAHEGAA